MLQANRDRFALTQAEVGELLGLSDHTIGNYENGDRAPDLQTTLGLALIFGKPPSQLFPGALHVVVERVAARFKDLSVKIENETGEAASVRQAFAASLSARLTSLADSAV